MRQLFGSGSRAVVLGWVLPLIGVLALTVIVWSIGGFRPAAGLAGPTAELGQRIELRRWTVVVHRVALVDTSPDGFERDPAFRVYATVTLTGTETEPLLPDLIRVRVLGGGPQPGQGSPAEFDQGAHFDPDVTRRLMLDYPWPDRKDPPQLPAPDQVAVVIKDEMLSRSYLYGEGWEIAPTAGIIVVPVDDRRKRS